MSKIKKVLLTIAILPYFIWRLCRRRTYYISGTGIKTDTGLRMWFKVTFITYGNLLPIKSIEENTAKQIGFDGCVVVFFQRIPNRMAKYVNDSYTAELILNDDTK